MILVDAGPLVALLDESDQHHVSCREAFRRIREPLRTVWPAFTEAMYLLRGHPVAQERLWTFIEKSSVKLVPLELEDAPRMRELMHKYRNRPMDLADAALVRVAERDDIHKVFTVDRSDFEVYRIHGRSRFRILPGA
jgi:predicted nucleic acid-binding protein